MTQHSRPSETDSMQPFGNTSAYMAAIRLKTANKQIFRALLSLASASLLIRVAGMVNQIVVTARFGQGTAMDAYFVASTLPTLLAQLLASALEASIIPTYAQLRAKGAREQASILFSTLLNLLLIGITLFTVVMLIFRSQFIFFTAPALDPLRRDIATSLTPVIFPVLLIMVMNSFLECLLNTEGQFGWPAYAGMLVPITTATLVLLTGKTQGVIMLCIGTLVGQLLQLGAIILRARRSKLVYKPIIDWRNPALGTIGIVAWPALFSALISQAGPLVDQMFASFLTVGSIAALNNALKLISVPTGVIFASVGRAALPYLARQAAIKDLKAFKETLRLYLWAVGITTLALTAFMIVLSHPIVAILFQHGAFKEQDTRLTTITLIGFVIGLTPMSFGFITSRAFSALGKTRTLMYITIFSVIANALFDYIFARLWQSFGIALATSAVYTCTMFILLILLHRMIGTLNLFTPPHEILKIIWILGLGRYYVRLRSWQEAHLPDLAIPYKIRQPLTRASIIVAVFAAGIAGTIANSLLTLRIAFGSIAVLALLRYRYLLLIIWVLVDAFIGSTLPFFNGNNLLSGLTIPTVLLLFYLPTKEALKRMMPLAFLLIYVCWVLLSIGISAISVTQFLTIWTILLDYVAVGVLTIIVINTQQRLLGLIDAILLTCLFIALYGIHGYLTKNNGIQDTATGLFRISSIFGTDPPTFALFLSVIIPLSFYRTLTLRGLKQFGGALLVILFLVTLGLTFTRGALISISLSMVVMVLLLPSRKLKINMLGCIAALVTLGILVGATSNLPIFSRFFNQDITTLNGRTYLWRALLDHFDPAQILGQGMKASDLLLINLRVGIGGGVIATAPHNIFLETLYNHGIIGATLLVLTLVSLGASLLIKMRTATPAYRTLIAAALAIFINVLIQSLENNAIWNQSVGIYFWIIMALPFALCWVVPKEVALTREADLDEATVPRIQAIRRVEQEQVFHV